MLFLLILYYYFSKSKLNKEEKSFFICLENTKKVFSKTIGNFPEKLDIFYVTFFNFFQKESCFIA